MMGQPRSKQDGPGKKKDGFHLEDHEEHANDVEARGIASASAGFRQDAAFVGLKFCGAAAGAGANVFEDDESEDGKREYQQGEEEQRDVGGGHRLACGRMLTQMGGGFLVCDPIWRWGGIEVGVLQLSSSVSS